MEGIKVRVMLQRSRSNETHKSNKLLHGPLSISKSQLKPLLCNSFSQSNVMIGKIFSTLIKQFAVVGKERPGSIVTLTQRNRILTPIDTSKELYFLLI